MSQASNLEPNDKREAIRFRAFDLSEEGWMQKDIAEALGVTEGAVSQWLQKAREGEAGKEALRTPSRPGRPPKLSDEEREEKLPALLREGAEAFGFRGDVWTRSRVGKVIEEHFGAEYVPSQVGRILRQIGWTPQKPSHRALRRSDEQIQRWKEEDWPRIKKKPERKRER